MIKIGRSQESTGLEIVHSEANMGTDFRANAGSLNKERLF